MSGSIADTYAVVDKSMKTKNKNGPSSQVPPSRDPSMDMYAVVDKTKKSKPAPQSVDDQDTYDAVTSDHLYYNTVANATYSQLDGN